MTENMQIAIAAINKWLYFGWNYESTVHEWKGFGEKPNIKIVPKFLREVRWTCNFDHIYDKWRLATSGGDPDTYLVKFYAELDRWNRQLLLEWVMSNYTDERKLF